MRASFLLVLAAGSALAQFQDLATPDDGSTLYFSSALRLDRSTQNLYPKLFFMDPYGIHLYAQQDPGQSIGWTTTNFFQLIAPDLSADGQVLAYTAARPCNGGSGCLTVERYQGHLLLPGKPEMTFGGRIRISRNARYALTFGSSVYLGNPGVQLLDLETGEKAALRGDYTLASSTGRRVIALDGTVIVSSGGKLALWRKSGLESLRNSQQPSEAMLNDAGTLVVYETADRLIAYDVKSAREVALAAGTPPFRASMTGDGSTIVFLKERQAWIVRSDGSGARRLTGDPAGITEAVLTGNGQFVYAVTGEGRMLRVDVGSDSILELVSRTPSIATVDPPVPGSLVKMTGTGFAEPAEVKLAGVDLPLIVVSPTEIWFQVPWDLPPGDAPLELLSGDSPFQSGPGSLSVSALNPRFYTAGEAPIAVHRNWDALVTPQNPAQPGEVLHFYLSGLGAVSPPVPTGQPAPAGPLARVVTTPRCQFWDGTAHDGELLYAGLAPGMIGIYQVELQVPLGLAVSPITLICDYGPNTTLTSAVGSLPVDLGSH